MPAPSRMLGSVYRRTSEANVYQSGDDGNSDTNETNGIHRSISDPSVDLPDVPPMQLYDSVFTSRPVSETKTMLWQIKEFENVYSRKMERAMNFEFELGRLGSMERHLPRRSRWRIALERDAVTDFLALRVLQLSPENKVVFYQLHAFILEGEGLVPENETELKIQTLDSHEGCSDSIPGSTNVFTFSNGRSCENYETDYMSRIQRYLIDGNLFIKIKIEIYEDSSSSS